MFHSASLQHVEVLTGMITRLVLHEGYRIIAFNE